MDVKLSYRTYEKKRFLELMVKRARGELKRFPLSGPQTLFDSGSELVHVAHWLLVQCHFDVSLVSDSSSASLIATCAEDEAAARLREILQGVPFPSEARFMRTFLLEEIRALKIVLNLSGSTHVPDSFLTDFESKHPGTVFGLVKSMHSIDFLRGSEDKV